MKPSQTATALETLLIANEPALIKGEPGIGKTAVVRQVAAKLGWGLIETESATREPVDFLGLPDVSAGVTTWRVPDYLPQPGCGPTIWFLDEFMQATVAVQNVLGRLVNERMLGTYRLPDEVRIVAAGNRLKDRAGTNRMPSHVSDRFTHLTMDFDLDDWVRYALKAGFATEVVAYGKFRPDQIQNFDPQAEISATARSWERVSRILLAKPAAEVEHQLYAGRVGEGNAAEFMGFLRVFRSLPSIDGILMNPDTAAVPTDPATLFAVAGAVARRATESNVDRAFRYAARLPEEFSVLLVTQAVRRDAQLQSTRAFIQWAADHQDVLI